MLNKLFKNKKNRYKNLILILLPFVILLSVLLCISYNSVKSLSGIKDGSNNKISASIDSMDYHLINNATDLQKDLFKELNKAVKDADDKAIATLVAENFVADFYTWTNKAGQFDVGGLYYVYSPQKTTIYNQARNQFYRYVSKYIEKYGQKNILEVKNVEAQCSDDVSKYEIDGESFDAYYVECNWSYVDHKDFTEKEYRTKEYFTIIKNADGRFEIVQAYGD